MVYKLFFAVIFVFISLFISRAEGFLHSTGARSLAMGNTSVALYDVYSTINNPSALPFIKEKFALGLDYKNVFELSDLNLKSGFAFMSSSLGTVSCVLQKFGFSEYSEFKCGMAFSRSFGSRFSVGLQGDYLSIYLPNQQGNMHAFTFEAGISYFPIKHLSVGLWLFNPSGTVMQTDYYTHHIPANIRFGIAHFFYRSLICSAEIEYIAGQTTYYKCGAEYNLNDKLFIRGGVFLEPLTLCSGGGVRFKYFDIDIGFQHHSILGISSTCSLVFYLSN